MNFNEYQNKALETAIYPNFGNNIYYPALGLGGEVGEVLEKIKKLMRDNDGIVTPEIQASIKKELGDVLWYLAVISYEFKIELEDVALGNIEKLSDRKNRNELKGNGDNR